MSQSSPGLRRELRTWQSLALSIAMMSPTLASADEDAPAPDVREARA